MKVFRGAAKEPSTYERTKDTVTIPLFKCNAWKNLRQTKNAMTFKNINIQQYSMKPFLVQVQHENIIQPAIRVTDPDPEILVGSGSD